MAVGYRHLRRLIPRSHAELGIGIGVGVRVEIVGIDAVAVAAAVQFDVGFQIDVSESDIEMGT